MRMLKVLGIAVAVVVVAVAAGAAIAVHYIQNNDMREWAAWGAKKGGANVTFGGPVSIKLWPELVVKVQQVGVAAMQGEGTLAHVDAAAVRMAWGSGLPWHGMRLLDVEAKNPVITLKRSATGVANWQTAESSVGGGGSSSGGGGNADMLPMLVATKLTVANLNLSLDDQVSGRKVNVQKMDLLATSEGTTALTKISGSVNGQDVSGEVRVDVKDMTSIPVVGNLQGAGLNVAVNGTVAKQKEFAGQVNVQTGNLKTTLQGLLGKAPAQAPADAFRLTGDVTAGAEKVVLRNFNTSLGDLLQASGNVNITLGDTPAASGQIKMQGSNLRQLAELATGQPQVNLPTSSFTLSTTLEGEDKIVLKQLALALGNMATVTGDVEVVPASGSKPMELNADVAVHAANVRALARAFGREGSFPEQSLQGKLKVEGKGESYSLKTFDFTLADLAHVSGNADITVGASPHLQGKFALSGDSMQAAARGFGVDAGNIPASPFKATASVSGEKTMTIDDLVVDLPKLLEATGKLAYTPGHPANLNGDVKVTQLNANALGYCRRTSPAGGASSVGGAVAPASSRPWSDEPIALDSLRDIAFDLNVDISGVSCESLPVSSVSAKLTNTPSQLDVKDMVVKLPKDSEARLSLTLEHAGTPKLMMNLQVGEAPIEELVPVLKSKGVVLPLNMTANLSSSGASSQALASNLAGSLSMNAKSGRLPYTSMLGNVLNIERMLQGDAALPDNGDGAIDSFNARYSVRQGVATTEEFALKTGAMNLSGIGEIDLGGWTIDYKLLPQMQASSVIEIPVLIQGPLGGPSIGADPSFISKLTSRLATEGVKGLLGVEKGAAKGVGAVVGGVLSGKGLSSEGVGDLINGFIKKPKDSGETVSDSQPASQPADPATQLLKGFLGK